MLLICRFDQKHRIVLIFQQPNIQSMKTSFLSLLFLHIFTCTIFAQSAWLDAAELNKYLVFVPERNRVELDNSVAPDPVAILTTLEKYCPDAVVVDGEDIVIDLDLCFKNNPFISMRSYAQKGLPVSFAKSESRTGTTDAMFESAPAASGGTFVTKLADGLAMFLVKRTKEELNAAFFDRLRIVMEKQPTFKALFPSTFDLLSIIGKEIYNYNAYLEALRESFTRDMKTLPLQVRDYSTDHQFIKKEEFRILTEDVLTTAQFMIDGEPPLEIVEYLSTNAALQIDERRQNIENVPVREGIESLAMGLRTLNLLSNSLRVRKSGQTWASTRAISDSLKDVTFTYLYLGLLYQQGGGIVYGDTVNFQGVLKKMHLAAEAPLSFRNYLVSLSRTGNALDESIKTLKNKIGTEEIVYDDYYRFADQMFDFLEEIAGFREQVILPIWKNENGNVIVAGQINLPTEQIERVEQKFLVILRQVYELEFNVRQNHYTSAVNNVAFLLNEVLEGDFTFKKEFLRYANFMATVAEAQTSEDVAAAIDLFALPPGSSRLKKQSQFSVSLNSYGGLAYGWENDVQKEVNDQLDEKSVIATSAPVGIGLNFGFPKNSSSISLYTQVIDVGAIFAYRFSNQTERIPEIKFENIIAPGFYAIYGFGKNIPVSAGIGAQLGPNLRKVDPSAGLQVDETSAWRFGFVLSVDIPITHFYTK
jgi:hypothetical protein